MYFRNGRINVVSLYIHRAIRVTPLLGVCILFSMSLFRFCANGPLWPRITAAVSKRCEQNWWISLLYMQNYVRPDDMVRVICRNST